MCTASVPILSVRILSFPKRVRRESQERKRETQLLREVRNRSVIFLLWGEHCLLSVKFIERKIYVNRTFSQDGSYWSWNPSYLITTLNNPWKVIGGAIKTDLWFDRLLCCRDKGKGGWHLKDSCLIHRDEICYTCARVAVRRKAGDKGVYSEKGWAGLRENVKEEAD